jgi:hypothetical protein
MWRSVDLPTRVFRLRLVCGIFASLGTALSVLVLSRRLGLTEEFQACVVFVTLSSQMFYATTAHVANDWLAVPLMVFLFERMVAVTQYPSRKAVLSLVLALSAGLLTKAYFLALVPLVVGIVAHARLTRKVSSSTAALSGFLFFAIAGPWYIRNIVLYRNITGMQEALGGTSFNELLAAFGRLPWLQSLRALVYGSLWTGNNSFTSFSSITLTVFVIAIIACCVLLGRRLILGETPSAERIVLLGCMLYTSALLYSTVLSYWYSKGVAITTSPWYTQPAVPVFYCLIFSVLSGSGRIGRLVAGGLVFLSGYIISLTYFAKLIPLYAGYGGGRVVLSELVPWYRQNLHAVVENLSTVALGDPYVILASSFAVTAGAVAFAPLLIRSLVIKKAASRRGEAAGCAAG